MDRGYLQISFAWLFAIIVGAFILFLAIFAVSKFIKTEQVTQDVETSKELGTLLHPLETSFETAKTTSITFSTETRIYNKCTNIGTFGEQKIQTQQKSFNKWTETDIDVSFPNKYIFSERYVEGKKIYIFSKPFEFPFKVADLIYITSSDDNYCFMGGVPEEIKEEILALRAGNEKLNLYLENCPSKSLKVCFGRDNCEINVDYNGKSVEKDGNRTYFENDALMYAGIFSDTEIYECQLKRLMKRTEQLSLLYADKEEFISQKCDSNLGQKLTELGNSADNLKNSEELYLVKNLADDIQEKNEDNRGCRLW